MSGIPGISPATEQLSQSVVLGLLAIEEAGKLAPNESLCVVALAMAKLLARDQSVTSRNARFAAVKAAVPLWIAKLLRDVDLPVASTPGSFPTPQALTPSIAPSASEGCVVVKLTDFFARRRSELRETPL